jgi:hypothetical protein
MRNIHVLSTDKPSRLIIYSTLANEFRLLDETIRDWKHKRPIYITNDEEIKEGDYGILGKEVLSYHQMHKKWGMPQGLKIILTTDQDLIKDGVQAIDDEFLEWFVKNPSCEEVEIRKLYETIQLFEHERNEFKKYKIIIPKEEPKTVFDQLEVGKDYKQEVFELGEEPKQDYNYIIEFGKYLLIKYDGLKSVEEHFKQFKNK